MTEQEAKLILDVRISRFDHASDVNEALEVAKTALEEIQQYRALGTVEELKSVKEEWLHSVTDMVELRVYRNLGTVEELREAREKQVSKEAVFVHPIQLNDGGDYMCPTCKTGTILNAYGGKSKYCPWCGQAIDWNDA